MTPPGRLLRAAPRVPPVPGVRRGLTSRLTVVFVLFAALLLAAMGGLAYRSGRVALERATTTSLLSTAVEKEAALSAWIEDRRLDLGMFGASAPLAEAVSALVVAAPDSAARGAARGRIVAELLPRIGAGGFLQLFLMDPESGRILVSTAAGEEGKFREDRPHFVAGRQGPYVQPPYYSLEPRGPAMAVSLPLRAPGGKLLGVLAGRLDLADMQAIVSRRTATQRSDEAFLVNRSSLFVTQPRLVADPAVLQRGVHTAAVRRCLAGESGIVQAPDYRGVPAMIVYRWLDQRQMCLVVKIDRDEALGPVHAFGRAVLLAGGLGLLAASVLAVGLARTVTRPVRALQDGVVRLGRGEPDVRLPESSRDELGVLAREFNLMATRLSEKEAQLLAHTGELERRTAQLEAANRELEAFAYTVSHDLRAPLRAMDGFSRILLEQHGPQLASEAQRYLGLVRENARDMGRLIDDLLRFSRLSRQPLQVRPVVPADLVRQALDDLRAEQAGRHLEIRIGELPPCQADPSLLKQVFVNLLANALKFTRGRAPARIEVGCRTDGPEPVYFVSDNGVGFDRQYAGKLFGVFQRLHRAEEFEGTGVGLAIVQRIVHRHGGWVSAEAEPDAGATFSFTLGTLGNPATPDGGTIHDQEPR